jgi:hypothetical protein
MNYAQSNSSFAMVSPDKERDFSRYFVTGYGRTLSGILYKAASLAVQRVLGSDTQIPGLVLTVQTAGEALNFNPHLQGLVTNGTFDEAGTFTPVTVIDTELLTAHFQDEVLSELVGRGLITDEVARQNRKYPRR